MESFTPYAFLVGGPVPVSSGVKDPRAVPLPADADRVEVAAADGSGIHVWTRTDRFRPFGALELREYIYEGPTDDEL